MKKLIQILSVCGFFVVMGGTAIADRFDQYEKSTSGEKLSCFYQGNQGSESHVWTYSDALYMDGQKVTDFGWQVSKKEGKLIFIVTGVVQLIIPIEFYINFHNSSSVETIPQMGIKVTGSCA